MGKSLLILFGGAGIATKGLVDSGCADQVVSVEIDPIKSYLSEILNPTVKHIVADVRDLKSDFIESFDMVWSSPPCQKRSDANEHDKTQEKYNDLDDLLEWSLKLNNPILWVENVIETGGYNEWGKKFNAAQFTPVPIQNRNRIIGGRYQKPLVYRSYQRTYKDWNVCPTILASEYKGGVAGDASIEQRKAMRWYGRTLALSEMAYHQGFCIPDRLLSSWYQVPHFIKPNGKRYTWKQWRIVLSEAIGNGVPSYMAYMFGLAYSDKKTDYYGNALPLKQIALF